MVDAAFLAQALLRSPTQLWGELGGDVKSRLIAEFQSSRTFRVMYGNKLLFCSIVEEALAQGGVQWDPMRVDYAIRSLDEVFYKGDGAYGDGPQFRWDYYDSFVMHPLLLDTLRSISKVSSNWKSFEDRAIKRAQRYPVIQERFISPEGSYPAIGRSITYRFGAFHALAQIALLQLLPKAVRPAQVRGALIAVIRLQIEAPGTFDSGGWLRVGFCGHQPSLGEILQLNRESLSLFGGPASCWSSGIRPFLGVSAGGLDFAKDLGWRGSAA